MYTCDLINPRSAYALLSSLFYDMLLLLLYRCCTKTYHNSCLSLAFSAYSIYSDIKIVLKSHYSEMQYDSNFIALQLLKLSFHLLFFYKISNRFFCFCGKDNMSTLYPIQSNDDGFFLGMYANKKATSVRVGRYIDYSNNIIVCQTWTCRHQGYFQLGKA